MAAGGCLRMLFDTHCHLTADAFRADLEDVLARARGAGVERIVSIASDVEDARDALARIADGVGIWTTAGVHPHEAAKASTDFPAEVRDLVADPRVVAIGECGLDYHYDHSPRDVQRRVFDAQIALAEETGLPLVVHAREADQDMLSALRALPEGVSGVLHCFSGGPELLEAALALGWHLSVTGVVSFRRFDGAQWLRRIPRERLMVETDAPYMAPVPHRGKRNEPAYIELVAGAVAAHRDEDVEDVRAYTSRNALAFYRLS